MRKTENWLIYTVFVGLIPFFSRILIFFSVNNVDLAFIISPTDFAILGLVLCITNINELQKQKSNSSFQKYSGICSLIIIFLGIILAFSLAAELNKGLYKMTSLTIFSILITAFAFYISIQIFTEIPLEGDKNDR